MRLTNTTDMPDDLVREVIRFVCPSGVTRFDFNVRNTNRYSYSGIAYPENRRTRVTISIGAASRFPRMPRPSTGGAYLPTPWLADRTEALVYVAAHELRHLWHAIIPKGRRVWGARGQYSERDADAYALRMLRAWRRERNAARSMTARERYLASVPMFEAVGA